MKTAVGKLFRRTIVAMAVVSLLMTMLPTPVATESQEVTNLALGMPVSTSATLTNDYAGGRSFNPAAVVDGIKTMDDDHNFWGTPAGEDVGSWLLIDLLTPQRLVSVKIDYRRVFTPGINMRRTFYTPRNVTIQVSSTAAADDWTTVIDKSTHLPTDWQDTDPNEVFDYTYTFENEVTARYVRVLFEDGGDSDGIVQIAEIEVNGYAAPRRNLALGKTATASSEAEEGWSAAKAVDGVLDMDSGWSSTILPYTYENDIYKGEMDAVEEWLCVDLGGICRVDDVVLSFRRKPEGSLAAMYRGVPQFVTFQAKENETDEWTTVVDKTNEGMPASWTWTVAGDKGLRAFSIGGVNARYVRVLLNGSSDDGIRGTQITELMVFGEELTIISNISASRENLENGTLRFTSNTVGKVYIATVDAGAAAPTVDTTQGGIDVEEGANEIALTNLTSGAKDVYFVVVSDEGVASETLKADLDAQVSPAPVVSNVAAIRKSALKATVTFDCDMAGTLYYVVVASGSAAPTIDTSGGGTAVTAGANTADITLSDNGTKDIYLVVKNAEGTVGTPVMVTVKPLSTSLVSKGKPAKASSELDPNLGATRANDGIGISTTDQNFWCTAIGQSKNSWWQVDLGEEQELANVLVEYRRVDLGNGKTRYRFVPKTVTIQVSNNGTDWATIISKSQNVPPIYLDMDKTQEDIYTYDLTGVRGRYVRLLFEDGTQDLDEDAIELVEVSVFAYDDATPTPNPGTDAGAVAAALVTLLSALMVFATLMRRKLSR